MLINDTQYELLALGLMVNNSEAAYQGVNELNEECFTDPNFRVTFRAISFLVQNQKEVNIYNINQELREIGQVFSLEELISIEDKFFFPEKFKSIIEFLLDRKRKLQGLFQLKNIENQLANSFESYDDIIKNINDLYHISMSTSTEILSKENYIETRNKHDKERPLRVALKTYYPEIDDSLTYKLGLGEISIIGARPSNGKSTFKTNLIRNVCRNTDYGVINYALEQTLLVESDRLESLISGIPIQEIVKNYLWDTTDPRWTQLINTRNEIATWNYFTIPGFGKSINEMKSELRLLKTKNVKLVFWDLFDRIREVSEATSNKPQVISKVLQQFLALAVELEMHFCLLVQMSRETAKKKDPRPSLHELKEAGAYEEAARLVFLLHYPGHYDTGLLNSPLEVDIAKQSNGRRVKIELEFDSRSLNLGTQNKGLIKLTHKELKNND
jgi:replicative DNA helicase